jgi:hypothetical protein
MIELDWQGVATVARVKEVLADAREIRIMLPGELHEPVKKQMTAEIDVLLYQKVAVEGDAEQLNRLAAIAPLQALADLVRPVQSLAGRVQVTSPPPLIIIHIGHRK